MTYLVIQSGLALGATGGHGTATQPSSTVVNVAVPQTPECKTTQNSESNIKAIGELATGLGSLMWPIVALVLFLVFKKEVIRLLSRIKKGKFGSAEIELEDAVKKLEDKVTEIKEETFEPDGGASMTESSLVKSETPARLETQLAELKAAKQPDHNVKKEDIKSLKADSASALRLFGEVEAVLEHSPAAALVLLASTIEAKIREIVKTVMGKQASSLLLRKNVSLLQEKDIISPELADALLLFWKTRNLVLHAEDPLSKGVIRKAIVAGCDILDSLCTIQDKVLEQLLKKNNGQES